MNYSHFFILSFYQKAPWGGLESSVCFFSLLSLNWITKDCVSIAGRMLEGIPEQCYQFILKSYFLWLCISWYFRNVVNENILQSEVLHTNLDLSVQKRNSYIKSNLRRVFKVIVATAKLKLNLFRKLFRKKENLKYISLSAPICCVFQKHLGKRLICWWLFRRRGEGWK